LRVCSSSPWVSHLLFSDDTLILINANGASARTLDDILQIYDLATGLRVNKEKSAIFLSQRTSKEDRVGVKSNLNIQVEAFSEKYLGLPTAVGRLTEEAFEYIADSAKKQD
jgi:hypothetical protein